MNYTKPIINEVVVSVVPNTNASEKSSCDGGHCVRAKYSGDHKI